jgi:alginate O-acetyltransferase complex protein AlgI
VGTAACLDDICNLHHDFRQFPDVDLPGVLMHIQSIAFFVVLAIAIRLLSGLPIRFWLISAVSAFAIYWLQPDIPGRYMSFWLPSLTIFVIVINWILTTLPAERNWNKNVFMLLFLSVVILLVSATRYLGISRLILDSRPPLLGPVLTVLAVAGAIIVLIHLLSRTSTILCYASIAALIGLFFVLKMPVLSLETSKFIRTVMGQTPDLATAADIRWLGFSYLAFRMIHTLRDRTTGRLQSVSLQEYFNYVVFFPAITAGPIDRLDRFIKDLRKPVQLDRFWDDAIPGLKRVLIGIFKKFVIADTLALVSINSVNIDTVTSNGWLWLLLYAYSLQIFLDFSAYTDIAIGIGRILGVNLPENFKSPYFKTSLTQFWNNWHITLTQWVRVHYFNPLVRWLRSSKYHLPMTLIMLFGQITTMLLIGLWHGMILNFIIWGLWHGVGLYLENRWSEVSRPYLARFDENQVVKFSLSAVSMFLTFNYVTLGWLWFALPEPTQALKVFANLFGFGWGN